MAIRYSRVVCCVASSINQLTGPLKLKILSIRQPWASLIVSGAKDVENRTWPTRYRGLVLIHASLQADAPTSEDIERRFGVRLPSDLPLGGIVGMTEIVDCVRPHTSRWYSPGHLSGAQGGLRA
jgi:ASCH domain